MNCVEFEAVVVDLAREEGVPAGPRTAALAHAEVCGRCGPRLEDERALTAGLRALAAAAEPEQAPFTVEAALRQAFARPQAPAPARPTRRWFPVWAAAALALVAVGYVGTRRPAGGPQESVVRPKQPSLVVEAGLGGGDEVFLPWMYGDDLGSLEGGGVVRVRLPRAALASFGLPVAEERRAERIEAEVLFGQDGLARAIHIVSEAQR